MRCIKCKKIIPSSATVCPYCNTPVNNDDIDTLDSNNSIDTMTSDSGTVDFGSISNTSYDEDNNLITAIKNAPKDKKTNKIRLYALLGVIGVFLIVIIAALVSRGNKKQVYSYYTDVLSNLEEFIETNFTDSDVKQSGNYKLVYNYNDSDPVEFKGEYALDVNQKLLHLTGEKKDPREGTSAIIINPAPKYSFDLSGKYNKFYLNSSDFYNKTIELTYSDETGLLSTKKYNIDYLLTGIINALSTSFKSLSYTKTSKENITFLNNDIKLDKENVVLDYNSKKVFLDKFYQALLDDTDFVSEYHKISGLEERDVRNTLNNLIVTNDYKYSSESSDVTNINIYHDNKRVYRYEIVMDEDLFKGRIVIDISDNKRYYLSVYKDGVELFNASIYSTSTVMNDVETRDFIFEYKSQNDKLTGTLELERDNNPSVKLDDASDYVNINSLTDDEYNLLKNNLINLMGIDSDTIDFVKNLFKSKCDTSLTCNCKSNGENCSCTYEGKIISCPSELVKKEE